MRRTRGLWASIVLVLLLVIASLVGFATGALKPTLGLDLEGGVSVILTAPEGTPPDVMGQALENIRNRVDAFGVGEPDIILSGSTIEVQIPGLTQGTIEERRETRYCLIGEGGANLGCASDEATRRGCARRAGSHGARDRGLHRRRGRGRARVLPGPEPGRGRPFGHHRPAGLGPHALTRRLTDRLPVARGGGILSHRSRRHAVRLLPHEEGGAGRGRRPHRRGHGTHVLRDPDGRVRPGGAGREPLSFPFTLGLGVAFADPGPSRVRVRSIWQGPKRSRATWRPGRRPTKPWRPSPHPGRTSSTA